MHSHLEIVMPPTDDIEAAVKQIMERFNEQPENGESRGSGAFWDFYVIGGRFSGTKLRQSLDKAKIDAFYAWMKEEKITVHGVQAGKQSLNPESQIPKVDAKWNELFPSEKAIPCPLFAHSNDQYDSKSLLPMDVQRLSDTSEGLTAVRIIIATPRYDGKGLEAEFMIVDEAWNGCNYMKTTWDETLGHALRMYREKLAGYRPEYAETITPRADWLVVTVDYHS